MKFLCTFGHVGPNGKPLMHLSRNRCTFYKQLLKDGRIDRNGIRLDGPGSKFPQVQGADPVAGPGPSAATAISTPEGEIKKESWAKRLSSGLKVSYHKVGTTSPADAQGAKDESSKTWMVSDDTVVRFWEIVFSFAETGINMLCKAIKIPDVPHEVFEVDPGQRFIFKTALRGFTTKILRDVFLAKSPEDADRIVAGLSGVLGFGLMALKIIAHFMLHVPNSPRIKEWKAKRAALALERRKHRGETDAENGGEPLLIKIPGAPA